MPTPNLTSFTAVETAIFVKMVVPDYQTLTFSNYNRPVIIGDTTYQALGNLLAITESKSDLNATEGTMTITISGIPNISIATILNNKIKGSKIYVYRAFFDADTGAILNITGNPAGRFFGVVNNYSLEETWTQGSSVASNTISLICSSTVELMMNKMSGRRTNPLDQKALYPGDVSMDRIPALAKSNFQFGASVK